MTCSQMLKIGHGLLQTSVTHSYGNIQNSSNTVDRYQAGGIESKRVRHGTPQESYFWKRQVGGHNSSCPSTVQRYIAMGAHREIASVSARLCRNDADYAAMPEREVAKL
jgi:hypothetical protein